MAYALEEPFGPPADDLRFGQIAAMVCNTRLKRGAKPIEPAKFALSSFYRVQNQKMKSLEDQKQMLLAFAEKFNAQQLKREKRKRR